MSLPRIENPTPTVKPAVPEKTFPDIFVREVNITNDPYGPWRASVMLQPYNYDTGEVDDSVNPNYINIEDLKAEAETDVLLAQAMGAILMSVKARLAPAEE